MPHSVAAIPDVRASPHGVSWKSAPPNEAGEEAGVVPGQEHPVREALDADRGGVYVDTAQPMSSWQRR